jgi:hypothetical protein
MNPRAGTKTVVAQPLTPMQKKMGEMTMPPYTPSSGLSRDLRDPEWSPETRTALMVGLRDPAKKSIVKHLRKMYRDLPASYILDILFHSDWDVTKAEESLKKLHGSLCGSPSPPLAL